MRYVNALIPLLVAGILLVGCSSPAVTGIKVHIQNGEYQDAVTLADSVIATGESENPEVWYWRGRAYSMMRQWEGAAESFAHAYQLDPAMAANMGVYWPAFYNTAVMYLEDGRTEDAINMLKTGSEIVPERPEFSLELAEIANGDGNYEEALTNYSKAIDLAVARINRLNEWIDQSQDADYIEQLREEIDQMVQWAVVASYNSGSVLKNLYLDNVDDEELASQYLQQAIDVYKKGIEVDPSNADLLTGLAKMYILSEQYDDALTVYDEALTAIDKGVEDGWLSEEDATAMRGNVLLYRGLTLIEMGRFDEGIAALEECRAQMGDTYQVLGMIGHAYFTMEQYENSVDAYKEITLLDDVTDEELADVWYNIYASYIRLEQDEDALQALLTAIEYDNDNADFYEVLAQTYSTLGRNREAIEAMEKARSLR